VAELLGGGVTGRVTAAGNPAPDIELIGSVS
jgi:hypothetical protein